MDNITIRVEKFSTSVGGFCGLPAFNDKSSSAGKAVPQHEKVVQWRSDHQISFAVRALHRMNRHENSQYAHRPTKVKTNGRFLVIVFTIVLMIFLGLLAANCHNSRRARDSTIPV